MLYCGLWVAVRVGGFRCEGSTCMLCFALWFHCNIDTTIIHCLLVITWLVYSNCVVTVSWSLLVDSCWVSLATS